jgi:hypothetical protein
MSSEVFWPILLVLLALCVGFIIPLLMQARKTAKSLEVFLNNTDKELTPLLKDLRDTSERASRLARAAEEDLTKVAPLMASLGDAGKTLHSFTDALNSDVIRTAGKALGFWLGMRSTHKAFYTAKHKTGKEEHDVR